MKKTIITILKFKREYIEIEAVEQISNSLNLPIFNNSIDSFKTDYDIKLFIKSSKEKIEKIVGGKISEMMVLISSYAEANLDTNNYSFEFENKYNFSIEELKKNDEIFYKSKYLIDKKIIKSNLNKVVKLQNNNIRVIKTISTIKNEFYEKLVEYTSQNGLNISNILLLDEIKSNNYMNNNLNLFVELGTNEFKINLINNKKILKTESFSFYKNEFVNNISFEYSLSPLNAYFIADNAFNNVYFNKYNNKLNANMLSEKINSFYNEICEKISLFLIKNKLNIKDMNVNFYQNSLNKTIFINHVKNFFNYENIYLLENKNEFISDEMFGLINYFINSDNDNNLSTTEIFTINANIIRNNKINKRHLMFV